MLATVRQGGENQVFEKLLTPKLSVLSILWEEKKKRNQQKKKGKKAKLEKISYLHCVFLILLLLFLSKFWCSFSGPSFDVFVFSRFFHFGPDQDPSLFLGFSQFQSGKHALQKNDFHYQVVNKRLSNECWISFEYILFKMYSSEKCQCIVFGELRTITMYFSFVQPRL